MKTLLPKAWLINDGTGASLTANIEHVKTAKRFNWQVTALFAIPTGSIIVHGDRQEKVSNESVN